MVTLISQKTSSGRTRTCSARCYNARKPKCVCICGGANHGIGLQKAVENAEQTAQEIAQRARVNGVQVRLPVIKEAIPTEVY